MDLAKGAASSASRLQDKADQQPYKQYDKIRVLGKGSFGTAIVYRRQADCSLVVLKEIDLKQFKGDKEKCSALNEARIMSTLNHINIIKYHNAYTTETKLLIEMEYASMGTLANYLSLQTNPLNEHEILVIFKQIVSGLNYLHEKNIVHLDLKTANIFITIDGLIKIGDFGIAQYMQKSTSSVTHPDDHNLDRRNSTAFTTDTGTAGLNTNRRSLQPTGGGSQAQQFAGTLAYSSPERCLGDPTGFKSDIWSLGCILYELITFRPLFSGDSLPEIVMQITRIQYAPIKRADVSVELRQAFERMISRAPGERPTARDLCDLLDSFRLQAGNSQQQQQQRRNKMRKRQNHGLDLSTDAAAAAFIINNSDLNNNTSNNRTQLRYPHSLIYQVRLNTRHIQIDRVNLPLTKRIKEICKGKSHYLVLTYDNIVFGWGSRSHGELGSCGLGVSSSSSSRLRSSWSPAASSSKPINDRHNRPTQEPASSTQLVSSSDTITTPGEPQKISPKAFIINELNHRKIIQVAAGNDFSVFLSKTGIVMTCGDGLGGCLGRGNFKSSFTPCMVESLLNTDVVSIASGPEHVVAVCGNGKAFAWGKSSWGRLGIGTRDLTTSQCSAVKQALEETGDRSQHQFSKFVSVPHPVQFSDDSVFIKEAFCADKCTIFIDSKNRCWACGENKSNKLGLDVRRRFKKTLAVDNCWFPIEITALSKYQIVSCNIGKNHTTFITSDGKLFVYGQDIDQTYRLESDIINGIDSHRKISFELQTTSRQSKLRGRLISATDKQHIGRHSPLAIRGRKNLTPPIDLKKLTRSTVINNQSFEFKKSKERLTTTTMEMREKIPKYSLTKLQRQQVDTFLKRSRATKKMPFECVIGSVCTKRFTLALTNDNRVYFWGTRSYNRNENDELSSAGALFQPEPELQLVPARLDECFVKIGATNRSLMNTIQALGSDQPIMQSQDPRLTANTLADLWILDYKPSLSSSSSSSSSISSSESSCLSNGDSDCCSSCCSLQLQANDDDFTRKHDAILDPQPIVSLYVPSMFNHSGCSLQLVDLFCFDEDKFYLVLDTTVKMHQLTVGQSSSALQQQQQQQRQNLVRDEIGEPRMRFNSLAGVTGPLNGPINRNTSSINKKQPRRKSIGDETEAAKLNESSRINKQLETLDAISESPKTTIADGQEPRDDVGRTGQQQQQQLRIESPDTPATSTDDNNNIIVDDDDDKIDHLLVSVGQSPQPTCNQLEIGLVASLDEPRSMSTFVANSVGNQIIVGPSMRLVDADQMEQLRFSSDSLEEKSHVMVVVGEQQQQQQQQQHQQGQQEDLSSSSSGSTTLADDCERTNDVSSAIRVRQQQSGNTHRVTNRRKSRQLRNKSESTTSFTCNETSPMPSWVRNEYNMNQRQDSHHRLPNQRDDYLFVVDSSSTTEDNCSIAERPLFDAGGDGESLIGAECEPLAVDDNCQLEETPRNSPTFEEPPDGSTGSDQSEIAVPILAASFLSQSQPDIRRGDEHNQSVNSNNIVPGQLDDHLANKLSSQHQHHHHHQLQVMDGAPCLTSRRSFATLDENIKLLETNSIVRENNLLDCNVYRNNNEIVNSVNWSNNLQTSLMNMSGLSTRSSSNNPLIGSPSLIRKGAELPLGGLNGRYAAASDEHHVNNNPTSYLWPSNSNLHDGLQRSSSSINETKLDQQQKALPSSRKFSKSVQQLNVSRHHTQTPPRGNTTNNSANSVASSLRKSLLKLFC